MTVAASGVHLLDAQAPPGLRLYAIGDVHGYFGLLERMHATIRAEIARDRPDDWRIIHIGDYVDRGPDSCAVLAFLADAVATDERIIALAGNHDIGMLDFLGSAEKDGIFARNGGRETALSYGVDADFSTEQSARAAADALRRAMPAAQIAFLETLPRSVAFGDFFFSHAGIRPGVPLDAQDPHDLLWIRKPFLDWPHLHDKVVVHGHTPSSEPEIMPNRVNIDTGVWMGRPLTAIEIDGRRKRILQVDKDDQRVVWTTP